MAVEVSQNEKISGRKEGISSAICRRRRIGGVQKLRNESEEELIREMLTPT